ncbi:hypothetical protein [Paenibacillus amylolyticus]|uniref:hypothetical protein n=1 Tax=Paenibacillus amylolyticus TaxID=1451 RepID=UPI003D9769C7
MFIRDLEGNVIPFGKVRKELYANFLDGTLPAWLETATRLAADPTEAVGAGTTFEPLPDRGTVQVTSPLTNNSYAELRTKLKFDSSKVSAIKFTLEAFQLAGNTWQTAQVGIKSVDGLAGITFHQTATSGGSGIVRIYRTTAQGGNIDRPVKMALFTLGLAGDEGQNRKNISILLLTGKQYPTDAERQFVVIMNDDQVGAYEEITGLLNHGELQCVARVNTTTGVPTDQPRFLKAAAVKVELWSN